MYLTHVLWRVSVKNRYSVCSVSSPVAVNGYFRLAMLSSIRTSTSLFTSSHSFWSIWPNYNDFFFFSFGWSALFHFPIFLLPLNVKHCPSPSLFFILLFSFSANHHTCLKSSYFPPSASLKRRGREDVLAGSKGPVSQTCIKQIQTWYSEKYNFGCLSATS